ncbi:MAG: extracellular solute-binding protein [Pseudomonadota bacterium]|nr:extracellular solute-binding protein [Pseudomonadota bacterium]
MIPVLALGAAYFGVAQASEVTLWHAWRGEERAALDQLVGQYNTEHPDTTVRPVFVSYESLSSKIEAAVPRGNGPDLLVFAHEKIGAWTDEGLILPVQLPAPSDPAAGLHPVTVDALTVREQVWGWPLAYKSLALFYNRALVPEPPTTTDALVAAAAGLRGDDRWGFAWEASSAYANAAWMHGFGGGVFDGQGAVRLDSPENAAAFGFVQTLAALGPAEPSGALLTQLFNEGRVAMIANGPWFLGEVGAVDYGVAPLPAVSQTGRPAAPYVTVEALFLAREGAEARAFAAWMVGDEAAGVRHRVGKQLVANTAVPVTDPRLAAFRTQLDTAVPMPTGEAMTQTWEPLARALRRLVRGAIGPEEAAHEAQIQYTIVSRPSPSEADPTPWLIVGALALVAGIGWVAREAWRAPLARWGFAFAWVAPAFSAMTLLVVLPFLVGGAVSLFEYDQQAWTFVGFAHFVDILLARDFPLTSPLSFWSTLAVTIAWTVANVILHVGIGVALAMLLREPWVRLRGAFRALLILPWAVPSYITALIWKGMFHRQFGAINGLLVAVGLEPVSWFAQWSTAFAANVTTNTWLGFPFMMVVTLGALQAIPRDLEEAAEVDGASGWQRFVHVTLPLLKPALLPAVILGSVWTFNMFNVIYLVSGGEPDGGTDILISQAYRWAFTRGHRYGYAAAYAVLIFGVLVLYGRVANRLVGRKVV